MSNKKSKGQTALEETTQTQRGQNRGQRKPKVQPGEKKQTDEKIVQSDPRNGRRATNRDITERKQAGDALQQSEEHFRILFDEALDGICLADAETGLIIDCNQALAALVGRERAELIGQPQKTLHPSQNDKAAHSPTFRQHLNDKEGQTLETQVVTSTGIIRDVEIKANRLNLQGREMLQGIFHDITERKRAEEALRESEEKYRTILENIEEGYFEVDIAGNFTFFNESVCRLLGYSREEMMGMNNRYYTDETNAQKLYRTFNEVYRTGVPAQGSDWELIRKDNTKRYVECSVSSIKNKSGQPIGFRGIIRDITERKRVEEELRKSEERFKLIFEYAPDAIYMSDLKGYFIAGNKAAEKITGFEREELIGGSFLKLNLLSLDQLPKAVTLLAKNALGKPTGPDEFILKKKGGDKVLVEITTHPIKFEKRTVVLGIARDITGRKRGEEELRESEERFRSILDNIEDGYYEVDTAGNLTFFNPAHVRILGRTANELMGMNNRLYMTPDGAKAIFQIFNRVFRTGIPEQAADMELVRPDGSRRSVEASVSLIKAADGSINGFRGTVHDITERKRAEKKLEEERILLRTLIDNLPDRVFVKDVQGHKLITNITDWQASGGKTMEDVIGKTDFDTYPTELAEAYWAVDKTVIDSGISIMNREEPGLDTKGNPVWVLSSKVPLRDGQGKVVGLVGIGRDITERKRTEEALRASEEHLRLVTDNMQDMIVRTDLQGLILYASPSNKTVLGYDPEYLVGRSIYDFMHPEDIDRVRKEVLSALQVETPGKQEYRYRHADGNYLWMESAGAIILDETRSPAGAVFSTREITERKQAEEALRASEARFRIAAQNASDLIWEWGIASGKLEWFGAIDALLGYAPGEFPRTLEAWEGIIHPDDHDRAMAALDQHLKTRAPYAEEYRVRRKDGTLGYWTDKGEAIWDDRGNAYKMIGVCTDITERKQAEQALRESENRFRAIFEQAAVGVAQINSITGEFVRVNLKYCEIFGYSRAEMLRKRFQEISHPDDLPGDLEQMQKLLAGEIHSFTMEKRHYRSDESIVWHNLTVSPMWAPGEQPDYHIAVIEDITARKQAEETLRESERELKDAQSLGRVGNWEFDVESQKITWSDQVYRLYERDPVLEPPTVEEEAAYYSPEQAQMLHEYVRRAIEEGQDFEYDLEATLHSGKRVYFSARMQPIKDAHGRVVKLFGTVQDITERKQAEEALHRSEERYRELVEQTPAVIYTVDPRQTDFFVYVSQQIEALSGYSPQAMIADAQLWINLIHPEDRARVLAEDIRTNKTGAPFNIEYRLVHRDGHLVWVHEEARLLRDASGQPTIWQGFMLDITERKQAEEALRESENRLRTIVEGTRALLVSVDANGHFTYANDATARALGYASPAELIGKAYLHFIHPEDRQQVLDTFINQANTRQPSSMQEFRIIDTEGKVKWFSFLSDLVIKDGQVVGQSGVAQDITERKRADEQIRRRNIELAAVNRIGQAFSRLRPPSEIVELLYTHIGQVLDNRNLYIALCDEAHQTLSFPVYTINGERHTPASRPFGNGLTEYVIRTGTPLLIPRNQPAFQAEQGIDLIGTPSKCFLAAPMRVGERVTGVIAVQDYENEDIYDANHVELIDTLAAQAAIALENARLYSAVQLELDERKRAEEKLATSEAELRALFAGMTDVVIVYDADGRYIKIAPTNPANLYRPLDDMLGKTVHDILPKEQADYIVAKVSEAIQTDQVVTGEYAVQIGGKEGWFASSASRLSETTAIWVAHDITKRKQAEEQIQRQVETLGALYDLSRTLSEIEDFNAILDLVTHRAVESAHVTFARVLLLEQDDLVVRAAFPVRVLDHDLQVGQREPLAAHPICQRILDENAPLVLQADSPEAGECAPFFLDVAQTLCIVPLHVREQPFGLLMLGEAREAEREPFTVEKLNLARSIGDQAVSTLHRALLHEATVRQLDQLGALHHIDQAIAASMDIRMTLSILLEQVTSQLKVDAASVLLLNPHMQTLEYAAGRGFRTEALQRTNLRLGEGYAGRAALDRKLIYIPDLRGRKTDFLRSPYFSAEGFVAYYGVPLIAKGQVKGVLEVFHRAPLASETDWVSFMETLAGQAAIAIDNTQLFDYLQRSNADLAVAYDATIEGWSAALDLRDKETEGHSLRVTEMTMQLARSLGIGDAELVHVRRGALLHDIGKMGVPDSILLKPDKLTDEEWVLMRKHPQLAFDMLAPITYLKPALDVPYCHHEKWDGTGYPRGLKGEEIPLSARIFAVVDVYDALISDRPYRRAWTREKTISHIGEQAGSHFDPEVVKVFLKELANEE